MSKDNRTSFEKALSSLRLYFDIFDEIDFFDVLAAGGKSPSEVRAERLKSQWAGKPSKDDGVQYLIQGTQCAYFAHEIVDALNANFASNEAVKHGINVICEKSQQVSFGEVKLNDGLKSCFAKGTASLECDLSKFTTATFREEDQKEKGEDPKAQNPDLEIAINSNPKKPDRAAAPCLSAIVVDSESINPSTRKSGGAALFLNHIPAMEMSRCIPHLDITISTPHPRIADSGGKQFINGISFTRFLLGNAEVAPGSGTEFFANAVDNRLRPAFINTASEEAKKEAKKGSPADNAARASAMGMEAFTSPQTMVMGDEDYSSGAPFRTAPVLDRFRPFLSIKGFKVTAKASFGLIQTKNGTLTLVLHDRSRLAEVSELIKVDMYGSTEILIEYGWNHPEPFNTNNPWGAFLDSLKLMEKYQIASASYSFDEVGQVTINLKIALKGEADIELIKVAENEFHVSGTAALKEVTDAVAAFKKQFPDFPEQKFKTNPRKPRGAGTQRKSRELWNFRVADFSDAKSFLSLSNKQVRQMRTWIRSQSWGGNKQKKDRQELVDIFKKIFAEQGKNKSLLEQIKMSIGKAIARKISHIEDARLVSLDKESAGEDYMKNVVSKKALTKAKRAYKGNKIPSALASMKIHDPFYRRIGPIGSMQADPNSSFPNSPKNVLNTTNFGTLFMNFVARPLAASGKYDEVQVIFYSFNQYASYMRDQPISAFPVGVSDFKNAYSERVKNGNAMFLTEFVSFMNSEYISNPSYRYGYGFGSLYKYDKKEKKHVMVKKYQENTTALEQKREAILADAYEEDSYAAFVEATKEKLDEWGKLPDLKFVQPRVTAAFECLPSSKSEEHTILRVSIFDAASSPNTLLKDMMKGSSSDRFEAITRNFGKEAKTLKGEDKKRHFVNQVNAYLKAGLLKVQGKEVKEIKEADLAGDSQLRLVVTAGVETVKEECRKRMSTITYGAAETNVISANVNSNAPAGLFEINLTRANLGHGRTALGAREANIPVEFAPVQLSMKTMGYPFFYIGQEFFVEFNTGTTVDNIYRVVEISHDLGEGSFNTNLKFTPHYAYGQSKSVTNVIADAVKLFDSKS